MASARALLVDDAAGLLRLLDPPLADAVPNAGYIQAYPPGVRENGGQYTHGGVWALMAQARLAPQAADPQAAADAVYRWFTYLSPAHRASHAGLGRGLRHRALRGGRRRDEPAAASTDAGAGAGTPARPPGCTARRSSPCSGCSAGGATP